MTHLQVDPPSYLKTPPPGGTLPLLLFFGRISGMFRCLPTVPYARIQTVHSMPSRIWYRKSGSAPITTIRIGATFSDRTESKPKPGRGGRGRPAG